VRPAVEAVFPAIEVVDDRWDDYKSVSTPSLIADDFFASACVVGEPVAEWQSIDLGAVSGQMTINGKTVGQGRGSDIMGHPLNALAWLANHLAARGRGLAAGEIVLLGSIVETKWVNRGDTVQIEIDGLGGAEAEFR
jgi:2-keto-4-pentenoate hydratase